IAPVEYQFPAGRVNAAVRVQAESPQLSGAAGIVVIVVGHVQELIVRRYQHAVGALDLTSDDPRDLAWRIDTIDTLHEPAFGVAHFHIVSPAVAGIAEIDSAFRI